MMIDYLLSGFLSYVFCSINPCVLIGKIKKVDVKKEGFKNPGASNAYVLFGLKEALFVLFFDSFKAVICLIVFTNLFKEAYIFNICAIACFLGHTYSIFLNFKGGMGQSTLFGIVLYFLFKRNVVFTIVYIISITLLMFIFDHLSISNILVANSFPFIYYYYTRDLLGFMLVMILTTLSNYKFRVNIKRILFKGGEPSLKKYLKKNK